MTQAATVPFPADAHRAALVARLIKLSRELDAETVARAGAETEADEARELVRGLQLRLAWTKADRDRLLRALGSRLLQGAAPFVLAGLVGGFVAVVLLRWAGW
jgi:hypothetical protein